jgi:hypothetical protein
MAYIVGKEPFNKGQTELNQVSYKVGKLFMQINHCNHHQRRGIGLFAQYNKLSPVRIIHRIIQQQRSNI